MKPDSVDRLLWDQTVLADKEYDADRIRTYIREKGAPANIPLYANRRAKPYFKT